jgi:hypothetical protein
MGRFRLGREEVASAVLRAEAAGSRAVFLVEVRGVEEQRRVRELFAALGELAEVAPLCDGPMMAYAVQLRPFGRDTSPGSLFTKIENTLKEEFAFSLVEQSFNSVIYRLVESLGKDSGGQLQPIPRCGICSEPEPFPTRVILRDAAGSRIIEACYCARCAAQRSDPSDREFLRSLLAADRRGFHGLQDADWVEWPPEVEAGVRLPAYRLAS